MKRITHYSQLRPGKIYYNKEENSYFLFLYRIDHSEFPPPAPVLYKFVELFPHGYYPFSIRYKWVSYGLYELDHTSESYVNLFSEDREYETS